MITQWVRVAATADLPPGEKMAVAVAGEEIALFNLDGTVYAIGDICTHAEASLSEGEFYDNLVECPLHGSAFDVTTGKAMVLPAMGNSGKYAVKVEDGGIYVDPVPVTPRSTR
ncbi:MAG TPA: non-heme iron oxygenase ferredoxin subunit [Chloroflexia bacterium]|nr:non-heme iron oxygenase ferredoxin subunit [Chloroflexia bacterium]